jgi:tRNA pseudouridine65 synthase
VREGASETLPIIYRDDSLIAIHKPAELPVHRSVLDRHETRFALQVLRDQIGQPIYPAHRLDKGTSGVLLFALDREVGRLLNRQFERGEVGKRYVAVVRGWRQPGCGLRIR